MYEKSECFSACRFFEQAVMMSVAEVVGTNGMIVAYFEKFAI